MATSYGVLYDSVLDKIKDYILADIEQDDVYSILHEYIRPAIVRFEDCDVDLTDRDEELGQFNVDLSDVEIEILSNYMVVEYLDANYIRIPSMLKSTLTSKDFATYSPANQLDKVKETRRLYMDENAQMMRNYSYRKSKLFKDIDEL